MILFLSHSLGIVTLHDPSVVDPFLSLIKIPFWYHSHYSLITVVILVASTRHAALNLACPLEVGQQA